MSDNTDLPEKLPSPADEFVISRGELHDILATMSYPSVAQGIIDALLAGRTPRPRSTTKGELND